VQLLGTNPLNLREVHVFDLDNINRALNKPASQSSTLKSASNAVNGNLTDMSQTLNRAGMSKNGLN
jgi:hypothetical protein